MRKRYRVAVAATTVIELLRSPTPETAAFFSNDKKKFHICTCDDRYARYMGLAGDFAMKRILGVSIPGSSNIEAWFKRQVKSILKADTQAEFFRTFDHEAHKKRHLEGLALHRQWFTLAKSSQYGFPTPERWGVNWWKDYGVPINEQQGVFLAERLTALYAYQKASFEAADGNRGLNVEKRDGDWIDAQQLVYLCEPDMHLLTDDSAIRDKAAASEQSRRILILSEFMKDLGIT